MIFKAFALTGRMADCWFTQGECPGLGASAPSGRVAPSFNIPDTKKGLYAPSFIVAYRPFFCAFFNFFPFFSTLFLIILVFLVNPK